MNESKKLVVVVEDDSSMRHALQRLLLAGGYSTRAFDSAEALQATDVAASAACLVLDIQLPGQSGLALYAGLAMPRPPAIFISANDSQRYRQAVAQGGGFDFLAKPFAGTVLLDSVARATHGVHGP